jgi:A/G-specific adenine glycosylase
MSRSTIAHILIEWFRRHGRNLPWRHTRDPYRILVAELMLQQTQVERVIPKYHAFLALFPTVADLANAPTSAVITAWQGLGYNRRAVYLQRTAHAVQHQYAGEFPRSVAELRALPGIGPYTAGAIACFAFEQDVGFLDTNIRRVIVRLHHDPTTETNERDLWQLAEQLVPQEQGWWWNQAIMELGALICTAQRPKCVQCPLRGHCHDYQARLVADEQLLATPTPPHKRVAERKKSEPFLGSNRYIRGRIIDALRAQAPQTPEQLCAHIQQSYPALDQQRLEHLLHGLMADGLIHSDEVHGARLPD